MEHRNWVQRQWDSVIYSDESKFELRVGDARMRVIHTPREAFHPDCLARTVKFPGSDVMIWGCIGRRGPGKLHFVEGTINATAYQHILDTSLPPSIPILHPEGEYIFQQDGATCHTARTTRHWLDEHDIPTLPNWPPNSPDLNPIENVWRIMKQRLRKLRPRTNEALKATLQRVWDQITPEVCADLYRSMHACMQAVIAARGDVTAY